MKQEAWLTILVMYCRRHSKLTAVPKSLVWFAKTLSDSDFNRIQGCRPQAKCDSTLGWSTPFGYS